MAALTYFYQECPVCGRSLRVRVQHFGRQMSCSHCGGEFQAGPPAESAASPIEQETVSLKAGFIGNVRCGAPQLGEV